MSLGGGPGQVAGFGTAFMAAAAVALGVAIGALWLLPAGRSKVEGSVFAH